MEVVCVCVEVVSRLRIFCAKSCHVLNVIHLKCSVMELPCFARNTKAYYTMKNCTLKEYIEEYIEMKKYSYRKLCNFSDLNYASNGVW